MGRQMNFWELSDAEWEYLGPFLQIAMTDVRRGAPRIADDRPAAQACLYRHFHYEHREEGYRCVRWNDLPACMGVSPSTANRRFREWSRTGAWHRFWRGLHELRCAPQVPESAADPARITGRFPVGDVLGELERAYLFFNGRFFAGSLPGVIGLSVERSSARHCLGYFCAHVWRDGARTLDHIAIQASALGLGAEGTLGVLLHEMVHLRNDQAGVSDCHPNIQYHNRYFRDLAVLSGLSCGVRDNRRGYAETELNDEGRRAVNELRPDASLFRLEAR